MTEDEVLDLFVKLADPINELLDGHNKLDCLGVLSLVLLDLLTNADAPPRLPCMDAAVVPLEQIVAVVVGFYKFNEHPLTIEKCELPN